MTAVQHEDSVLTISGAENGGSVLELRLVTDENQSTWSAVRVIQEWAVQVGYAMADSANDQLHRLWNPVEEEDE